MRRILVVTMAALAGCGGGSTQVAGSVKGQPLPGRNTLLLGPVFDPTVLPRGMGISISEHDDACAALKRREEYEPSLFFSFIGGPAGIVPGEYEAISLNEVNRGRGGPMRVWGQFTPFGGAIAHLTGDTFKLDSLTLGPNASARGSFDLKFGDDAVQGTFDATACSP